MASAVLRANARLIMPTLVFLGAVSTAVGSLGAPLLPTIARLDGVSLGDSQWALTISLVTGAVAAPILGRLADGRHRRRVIIAALAVVAIGCAVSALPLGFGWLLVGRALQGIGLGLVPLSIAAARDALPPDRMAPGIALLGVTTAAGLGIGYPIAGVIAQFLGFHAAFWTGALLTLIALVAVTIVLPPSPERPSRTIDVPGAVLLGATIVGILLVTSQGPTWGWASPRLLGTAAASVVVGVAWAWWELRAPAPLVALRQLRHPSVIAADLMVVIVGIGIYPLLSLVVRYVQAPASTGYGFGASEATAGLMLVPYSLASFAASRAIRPLLRRASFEVLVIGGSVVLVASMALFLLARENIVLLAVTMALAGFGIGAIFAVHPAQIHVGVPPEETASANSFYQVLRYVGYSLGSALSATSLVSSIPRGSAFPTESGYSAAAWLGIGALVVGTIAATVIGVQATRTARQAAVVHPPGLEPGTH